MTHIKTKTALDLANLVPLGVLLHEMIAGTIAWLRIVVPNLIVTQVVIEKNRE